MCSTCGCHSSNEVIITKIGDEEHHEHLHGHSHGHLLPANHEHHHEHGHTHGRSHDSQNSPPQKTAIQLEQDILQKNDLLAERNRGYFEAKQILTLNLVSSPGSGKTTLLQATLNALKDELDCYVIEGDQQSTNDANRIAETEVPVVQINTGKGCHLDANMVHRSLRQLNPGIDSILFIENVGNLVCPALFDLGERARVIVISVTEGDDKPMKYPDMFHTSDLCLINKVDLLPYVSFDVEKMKDLARRVNPNLNFIEVSATKGTGMEDWLAWLKQARTLAQ